MDKEIILLNILKNLRTKIQNYNPILNDIFLF